MASNGLVIQWGIPHHDTDMEAFINAVEHYRFLKRRGAINDVHIYLHAQGELSERTGTLVVDATCEQLNTLIYSEEHARLIADAKRASANFSMTRVDADANTWLPPARTPATTPEFR